MNNPASISQNPSEEAAQTQAEGKENISDDERTMSDAGDSLNNQDGLAEEEDDRHPTDENACKHDHIRQLETIIERQKGHVLSLYKNGNLDPIADANYAMFKHILCIFQNDKKLNVGENPVTALQRHNALKFRATGKKKANVAAWHARSKAVSKRDRTETANTNNSRNVRPKNGSAANSAGNPAFAKSDTTSEKPTPTPPTSTRYGSLGERFDFDSIQFDTDLKIDYLHLLRLKRTFKEEHAFLAFVTAEMSKREGLLKKMDMDHFSQNMFDFVLKLTGCKYKETI